MTQLVDVDFLWCPRLVPEGVPVVQVYGWLVDDTGRVLVQDTGDRFNLPGGSPEPIDVDLAATVIREAMEESQVTVTDVVYLGYEQVLSGPPAGVGADSRQDRRVSSAPAGY